MIRKSDIYGADERRENLESMEYPAKRQENKKVMEHPAVRPHTKMTMERRVRYVRRWWYSVNDDYKELVWIASVFLIGVAVISVYALWPR